MRGPDSNLTSFTTHTKVSNRYTIKHNNNVKLDDSYKIPTAVLFILIKFIIFLYFIIVIISILKKKTILILTQFISNILNFSFAAKVLMYIIKIITPPKNTKMIK